MKTNARTSAWTEEAPVSQPQGRVIRSWKDYSPEIVSLLLTWGICGGVCVVEWARFHRIEYAIDDTYIHMAIAKHLSRNSIWGVTPYEFSSSSSSILYTLLLAALDRLQIQARLVPLFLNLLFASLSLVIFAVLLRRHGVNPRAAVICLVAIVLLAPLPPVIFVGLEHSLQIPITVGFIYLASVALALVPGAAAGDGRRSLELWLLVMAPLVTAIRYEGMFPLALVCLLYLLRRRPSYATALGALGLAPIVIHGLFSISHGWMFFPNTLMMKASLPRQPLALLKNLIGFAPGGGYVGVVGLIRFPYITSFLVACLIGFVLLKRESGTIWRERELFLLLNMGTLLLHMQFARTGWFYRYEAYFITGSILATALALHSRLEGWFVTTWRQPGWYRRVAIAGLLFVTPAYHEIRGIPSIIAQTRSIYEYEVQLAFFLHRFYDHSSVVIGDIGSTNYFNDLHMIDFEGLGSIEVAREWIRNNRRETPDFLGKLANEKGAVIAVGHRDVWEKFDCVPMSWIEVGTWVASGNPRHHWEYVFYAVKPSEAERLRSHLKAFSTELPGWVETKLGTDLPVDKSS